MKDIRFFLQEFGKRHPDLRIAPMVNMNSDKEMYFYLVDKLENAKKHSDGSESSTYICDRYEFLVSFMKSCVIKGGFPPEVTEFRRRVAKLPPAQRDKEFHRTLALISKW